ncbi:MAG: glycosyltransferase family 39 protein [Kiritimatiellae bacterium]|nr:glycosyltransferase family 39 protein [Kiritimatiellia bacterium]
MKDPVMTRPAFVHLLLVAAFLWVGEMVRRDLWTPDEVRYAYVADEMRAGGHWLVPHRNGEVYVDKPPLLFWLNNAFSRLTGLPIGRVTSRLPGFLAGLATLWMVARLAERWRGPAAAWPAVLVLCTNYLFWHEIGFGRIDGLLLGLTTAAIYLLVRNDDAPGLWRPALAYACMGLAILAKGPVGFFVPAGAYAALRWAAGEGRCLKKWHWLWGPLITLTFPAAWLGLVWWQGAPEGYFRAVLYQQNIARAAGELGHEQPWYYFLATLPADLFPWTLLLPAACLAVARDPETRGSRRRLAGWILFVIVFFTLSHSKRHIYILGAFPAVAILLGGAWADMARSPGGWIKFGVYAFLGVYLVAGIGCLAAGLFPRLPIPAASLWPVGLAALGGAAWMIAELRRRGISLRVFYAIAATMFLVQWGVGTWIYPAINPLKTPTILVHEAQAKIPPGHPLLIYQYNGEIFAYYARRPGRVCRSVEELEAAMRREGRGIAVFLEKDWDAVHQNLRVPGTARPFKTGGKELIQYDYDAGPAGA